MDYNFKKIVGELNDTIAESHGWLRDCDAMPFEYQTWGLYDYVLYKDEIIIDTDNYGEMLRDEKTGESINEEQVKHLIIKLTKDKLKSEKASLNAIE